MSTKKKTDSVQSAEKTIEEASPPEALPQVEAEASVAAAPKSGLDSILAKVDPKQIQMANQVFPLTDLIKYLREQELKVNYMIEHMPDEEAVKKGVTEALQNFQQRQVQQFQQAAKDQPQGGAGMLSGAAQYLPALLQMFGGAQSQDAEFATLGKDLMKAQIERMKADMSFTDSIKNALVSRLVGKAVDSVTETI